MTETDEQLAEVTFTFIHACEHPDYSQTVLMPAKYASTFSAASNCGVDGMTMLIRSRVNSAVPA